MNPTRRSDEDILARIEPHLQTFAEMAAQEAVKQQFTAYNIPPRWVEAVFGEFHPTVRKWVLEEGGNEALFQRAVTILGSLFDKEYEKLVPRPKMT